MALHTSNIYGDISISDGAVAAIISRVTRECYGVVDMASRKISDTLLTFFNREPIDKGVKIETMDNRIYVDLYIIINENINKKAIEESVKSSVQYNVERLTGMRVKKVDVHIWGLKI